MKTRHLSPTPASSPSFALISVLALVSLAALTATAFLASARLERQATMPLSQNIRLEMALSAGADCAKEVITMPLKHFNHVTTYWRGAGADDWTNELGYLLNGSAKETSVGTKTSTVVNFACCFSTATFTNLGTNANELIVISNNITSQGTFLSEMSTFMYNQTNFASGQSTNIRMLGNQTSPPVGWVYIRQDVRVKPGSTNTTNVPVARFAFFVQDLCGMIDAERMGDTTNGIPFRQSTVLPAGYALGTNPADISLTNMTGSGLTNLSKVTNLTASNNRLKYLTPGMLVFSNAGNLATNDLRYFTTGLRHWTNAYERIPMGLGYPRSWEIKTQLKDVNFTNTVYTPIPPPGISPSAATPTTNTNFILFISNNLTNFALRSGGMNTNRYLNALAASAQDYVDSDGDPTVSGTGNSAVRGIEPLPFVTETATSVWWYNHGMNIEPYVGSTADEIRVENYIELWNPSDRRFSGNIRVCLSNNYSCGNVTWASPVGSLSGGLDLTKQSSASRTVTNSLGNDVNGVNNLSVTLDPNQYGVYSLGTNIHKFRLAPGFVDPTYSSGTKFSGGSAKLSLEMPGMAGANIYKSKIELYTASGILYSQATNLMRTKRTLGCNVDGDHSWFGGSLPSLRMDNAGASAPALPGDPRFCFYLTCIPASTGYKWNGTKPGATLGYRNYAWSSVPPATEYDASPKLWMDGGHANSPGAPAVTSDTDLPTLGVNPATSDYVQKFNNTGTWSNIFELGNIFDPMAWNVPVNSPCLTTAHSAAGNGTTVLTNGGGTTLRIGRAEHQRFAWTNKGGVALDIPNMQMSSAALLDMFCVKNQPDQSGQINLNTASAPVLRALAGGIRLVNDPAQLPPNLTVPTGMAEAFAQGVMRFRAKYPFYSPSQLAFIGTDPTWPNSTTWPNNAVFGNTNTISLVPNSVNALTSTSLGITEWSDQAAEEWFAKVFKLSTTSSQNFRVYVIAQKATNQGNNLIGVGPVVRKYYNILVRINTDDPEDIPPAGFSTLSISEAPY